MSTLLSALVAFVKEHQHCGDLDGAVEDYHVWMTCTCGAVMRREKSMNGRTSVARRRPEKNEPAVAKVLPMQLRIGDRRVSESGEWVVTGVLSVDYPGRLQSSQQTAFLPRSA